MDDLRLGDVIVKDRHLVGAHRHQRRRGVHLARGEDAEAKIREHRGVHVSTPQVISHAQMSLRVITLAPLGFYHGGHGEHEEERDCFSMQSCSRSGSFSPISRLPIGASSRSGTCRKVTLEISDHPLAEKARSRQ
jgi:hypothetical protein